MQGEQGCRGRRCRGMLPSQSPGTACQHLCLPCSRCSVPALHAGEEIAHCPSCSLYVKVIYDPEDFQDGTFEPEPEGVAVA